MPRTTSAILADPALRTSRWVGSGPRDLGVIAEHAEHADGTAVGVAWWRFLRADGAGQGFVSADVPEVSVTVLPALRAVDMGGAAVEGLVGLSLSVERDPAEALYRRLGFVELGGADHAATMLREVPG